MSTHAAKAAGAGHPPDRLDILWGAKKISRFLGCGIDFVYGMRDDPASPIRKRRGQLYAFREDLIRYMQADENQNT